MSGKRFTDINYPDDLLRCPLEKDWPDHHERARVAMQQINTMHSTLAKIEGHTSHLSKLDDISSSLLNAATSKNHVSLLSHLTIVLILGAIILIVLVRVRGTGIGLKLSPSGLEIGAGTKHEEGKP